jgi:hypothetical protein
MKKKDFIKNLEKFPDNMEITITDGYEGVCYHGNFQFQLCKEHNRAKTKYIDIGIGGLRFYDKLPFAH